MVHHLRPRWFFEVHCPGRRALGVVGGRVVAEREKGWPKQRVPRSCESARAA